jgi:hypothetical protein
MVTGVSLLFIAVVNGSDHNLAVVGSTFIGMDSVFIALGFFVSGAVLLRALSTSKFADRLRTLKMFFIILAFSLAWIGGGVIWCVAARRVGCVVVRD